MTKLKVAAVAASTCIIALTCALFLTSGRPAAAPASTSGQVGRYTIIHSPHVENDTMLIDTATGRTWRLEDVTGSGGEVDWVPVTRGGE
jgi:hypothetical protein